MAGDLLYLDSSALVKLVFPETETAALMTFLKDWPDQASSAVCMLEVLRAARRASRLKSVHQRARRVVEAIHHIQVGADLLEAASLLAPATLRSLDALHLASALSLGDDLGAMAVYDRALSAAATDLGLPVVAPGAS